MARLEMWKEYYSIEWHDDQSMGVLFSQFRQNREINPHSWDKKLQFWSDMIKNELSYCKKVSLDADQLPYAFSRKGSVPKCLNTVLNEMLRSGQLVPRYQFEASVNQGWVSWGFDLLVKRPVFWSFGKVFGSNGNVAGEYIVPELIKDMSQKICDRFVDDESPGANLIEMNDLLNRCSDICADMDTLSLIVLQLIKDKKAVVVQTEKHEKVVRFITSSKKNISAVSDLELKTLKLKKTEEYLRAQVLQLSDDMDRCKDDARFYLKKGLRNSAKSALRRKQTLGRMLNKREVALETIHNMMQQIHEAESHKKILDAYKAGASAFKDLAAKHHLTTDNIDEVMSDVQEVFDMQSEINDSMAYNPAESTLDYTTADLEEELSQILAGASDQQDSKSPASGVVQNPSAVGGDKHAAPMAFDSGLSSIRAHGSPFGTSTRTPPRGQQFSDYTGISPSNSPQQGLPTHHGSNTLNRTFTHEETDSPSQISGASSSLDSYGLPSRSSDSDMLNQLEALKIMEELNLPEVPTFDPATPPRDNSHRMSSQQNWSPQQSKINKSKMRPLTS